MRSITLVLFLLAAPLLMAEERLVGDGTGNEIPVEVMPAAGNLLMIWLVDHTEEREMFDTLLRTVNRSGVEIWRVDLLAYNFLPRSSEAIRRLPGDGVAAIITAAHQASDKRILLAAYDRMPLPLLRGVHLWQETNQVSRLAGAMLFYPNLFAPPPVAGEPPVVDPILNATNIPLVIYQPALGSQRWRLDQMLAPLWRAGAPAYAYIVPEVRDWFFMGETDHGPGDRQATELLPRQILRFAEVLDRHPKPAAARPYKAALPAAGNIRTLVELAPHKPEAPFTLTDIHDKPLSSTEFSGKVALVNFWATWCPPCVEELPSLNRLQQRYADEDVRIVSIDFRETQRELAAFLLHTPVDFPVLMDSEGQVALAWQVFSFPSSFIVDRQGRIRYSANRAIDWNAREVWQAIDRLLSEE